MSSNLTYIPVRPTDDQIVDRMARTMREAAAFGGGVNDDDLAAAGFTRRDIRRLKDRAVAKADRRMQSVH